MVTGWYDLFLPAQLDDFRDLQRAGRSTRITIGPWAHADPGNIKAMLADTATFLSAHLRGKDSLVAHLGGNTSELNRAPVRVYLQHADRWLDFPTWPPEEATPTPIHLHDGRTLDWAEPEPAGRTNSTTTRPTRPRRPAARCSTAPPSNATTPRSRRAPTC